MVLIWGGGGKRGAKYWARAESEVEKYVSLPSDSYGGRISASVNNDNVFLFNSIFTA